MYTVWQGDSYIYAGMSGRGATKEDLVVVIEDGRARTARGLSTRLKVTCFGPPFGGSILHLHLRPVCGSSADRGSNSGPWATGPFFWMS